MYWLFNFYVIYFIHPKQVAGATKKTVIATLRLRKFCLLDASLYQR